MLFPFVLSFIGIAVIAWAVHYHQHRAAYERFLLGRVPESVRKSLPSIMLTALGEEADRVLGLETGADDYLSKPFSSRALRWRSPPRSVASRRRGRSPSAGATRWLS